MLVANYLNEKGVEAMSGSQQEKHSAGKEEFTAFIKKRVKRVAKAFKAKHNRAKDEQYYMRNPKGRQEFAAFIKKRVKRVAKAFKAKHNSAKDEQYYMRNPKGRQEF